MVDVVYVYLYVGVCMIVCMYVCYLSVCMSVRLCSYSQMNTSNQGKSTFCGIAKRGGFWCSIHLLRRKTHTQENPYLQYGQQNTFDLFELGCETFPKCLHCRQVCQSGAHLRGDWNLGRNRGNRRHGLRWLRSKRNIVVGKAFGRCLRLSSFPPLFITTPRELE